VHFSFGEPIGEELNIIDALTIKNDQFASLADMIDTHVHKNYHLWPGNYIVWDMLNHSTEYKDQYTDADKAVFLEYINDHIVRAKVDDDFIRTSLLEMYANPVVNKKAHQVKV
jgi:hypothetical protein